MKALRLSGLFIGFVLLAVSCSKDSTETAAQSNAKLLAGNSGSSKSWNIVSISYTDGTNSATYNATSSVPIPTCELDNTYQFSNTSSQTFQQLEGTTTCNSGDPTVLESGTWALTNDGKSLLIDGTWNVTNTQSQYSNEPFVVDMLLTYAVSGGTPFTITQLTSTALTLKYSFLNNSGNTITATLVFASK